MVLRQSTKWVSTLAGTFALLLTSMSAHAFESMKMGSWDVDISGNINGFSTNVDCDTNGNGDVSGGLACGSFTALGGDRKVSSIRTGLLPSWFGFHAKQVTDGLTTEINIGFQPGIDGGGGGIDGALSNNSENLRVVNLKFGTEMGTIMIGRDLGLYGSDAILSDMTLLGVGTVSDLTAGGGNTSLGRIGVGYLYADWKAQIQYTSPDFNGFSYAVAIVDPWGLGALGPSATAGVTSFNQEGDTYGFEGKAGYTWGGDNSTTSGKVWASFISQSIDSATVGVGSEDATGFDVGGKVSFSGLELVGYFYSGEGIGTTGFLLDALSPAGVARDSDGFYVQGTYTFPEAGTKVGVSFGESNLDLATGEAASTLVETNESFVVGLYHPLTSSLNLVVEYTKTEASAHNGNSAEESSFAFGAILFY